MNYGELKNLIEFYLHRTDFAPVFPQIFEQARERIGKDARLLVMEKTAEITLTDKVGALPADFIEARHVMQAATFGKQGLQYLDRAAFAERSRRYTGGFAAYTINGLDIECGKNAPITVYYYAAPAKLVADSDTNVITERYPNLYIYAVLSYCHNAVQDYESEQIADQRYMAELMAANEADDKARRSGDAPAMIAR